MMHGGWGISEAFPPGSLSRCFSVIETQKPSVCWPILSRHWSIRTYRPVFSDFPFLHIWSHGEMAVQSELTTSEVLIHPDQLPTFWPKALFTVLTLKVSSFSQFSAQMRKGTHRLDLHHQDIAFHRLLLISPRNMIWLWLKIPMTYKCIFSSNCWLRLIGVKRLLWQSGNVKIK